VLVPPNERARKLADYLRVAIVMHFFLAIFMFLGARWFDGAFNVLAVAIGYLSIRQSDAFSIQQLFCYTIFCGIDFVWAVISIITFVSNVTSGPAKPWQFYLFVGTLTGAPLIYVLCCYLSYQVYKELKNTVNDMVNSMENGFAPQPSGQGGAQWNHPEIHPSDGSSGGGGSVGASSSSGARGGARAAAPGNAGYTPFAGPGYRLGGT